MKLEYLESGARDCPLVRLYDLDGQSVKLLVKRFYELSEIALDSFELHEMPGVEPVENIRFKALVGNDQGIVQRGLGPNFELTLSQKKWDQLAGLAEAFVVQESTGRHQWLDNTSGLQFLISNHRGGTW